METKLELLRNYFYAIGIEAGYVSTNLVADVCYNYFPHWEVTGDDVVFLADNI